MNIEADDAQTTEAETVIIGEYKTTKLELRGEGFVIQYVDFD